MRPFPAAYRAFAAAAVMLASANAGAALSPGEWDFAVTLDGKPVGSHRFIATRGDDGALLLTSDAGFDVRLLGIPLYRYRHRVIERWVDGCLDTVDARTEDNGRVTEVQGRAASRGFELRVREDGRAATATDATRCLMTFAYWNPDLARQAKLLDPGSGRIESVAMAPAAVVPEDLGAQARGLRIGGLPRPIDVWYQGERWIGLDAVVGDGRRLRYRLR